MEYVSFPGLGIENLPISRVAFSVFGLPVYWYGILIATGVLLCVLLAMRHAPHYALTGDDVLDVCIAIVPLMIVFARLYYVVFSWDDFRDDLLSVFNVRQGGLAFYGGVIGGALAIWIVCRVKKIPLPWMLDFIVVYLPLGQAIGRWGNFFNQEAFGTNTTLPWGMYSAETSAYLSSVMLDPNYQGPTLVPSDPVHPTFFYEFVANLVIFALLLLIRSRSKTPWTATLSYLGMYGFVRFFVEGIRTDALYIPGTNLRISMWLSAAMVLDSLVLLWILRARAERKAFDEALAAASDGDEGAAVSDGSAEPAEEPAEEPAIAEEPHDAGEAGGSPRDESADGSSGG